MTESEVFTAMRRTWQPVANVADVPAGKVIGYKLLERDLVIAHFPDGRFLAADVACPHKGARLSAGSICGDSLACAYHGWTFDAQGVCNSIPSLAEPSPEKLKLSHLNSYPVQAKYGYVWVKLDPSGTHELPEIPEFQDPKWRYVMGPPMFFAAGFRREVENYLDMTHFAFAHRTTLGKAAAPVVPPMSITVHSDGGFEMNAPFPSLSTLHEQPGKLQSAHHRQQRGYLPNFTTIRQSFNSGGQRLLVHIPSPHTVDTCTVFWSLAVSPDFDGPPVESQIEFAVKVLDEDRQMCELQIPSEVPIEPARGGWGVLVTPGDTLSVTFQKCLRQWLVNELRAQK